MSSALEQEIDELTAELGAAGQCTLVELCGPRADETLNVTVRDGFEDLRYLLELSQRRADPHQRSSQDMLIERWSSLDDRPLGEDEPRSFLGSSADQRTRRHGRWPLIDHDAT